MCPILSEIQDEARYRRHKLDETKNSEPEVGLFHLRLLRVSLDCQVEHMQSCPECYHEVTA